MRSISTIFRISPLQLNLRALFSSPWVFLLALCYFVPTVKGENQEKEEENATDLRTLLRSIPAMPQHMWMLCITNFFSWTALLLLRMNFTHFVGVALYDGKQLLTSQLEFMTAAYFPALNFLLWSSLFQSISLLKQCYSKNHLSFNEMIIFDSTLFVRDTMIMDSDFGWAQEPGISTTRI